jgi:TnpA family transposase
MSLILQENTQTTIIRKLSSHDRYAKLQAALYEYNKIFKTIHVLNMINDLELRKAIRAARNRTEAYHQLQGRIRKVYQGIFKGKKIIDNQVSSHAIRLLANCIIAYSGTMLDMLYRKIIKEEASQFVIDEFVRISPIAWGYITFTGRYNFKKNTGKIDLQEILNTLEAKVRTTLWKKKRI